MSRRLAETLGLGISDKLTLMSLDGDVSHTMNSSCSRVRYIATLENPSNADGPEGKRRPADVIDDGKDPH